jgi:hypothetical protein
MVTIRDAIVCIKQYFGSVNISHGSGSGSRIHNHELTNLDPRGQLNTGPNGFFFKFKDGVFHYIRTQFPPPPSL